ncbi:zf-HC2 domain-containing protein [Streptomyces calidiresistens]|uniref:zf-HC2 domain-containing protein n=1 Tax=Streptomyces calidiresistens TaxID=1485586 RepID=UPI001E2859ED|nr:zf-HC2 domain-containing protein [Streptomyces calidiresistens]
MRLRIDCARVGRILHAHLAGEVSEADARWVTAHLEACLHCGMDADLHRRISSSLARRGAVRREAVTRLIAFGESLVEDPRPRKGTGTP